jgi:cysteine desulfurase
MEREDHRSVAGDGRPAGWPGVPVYLDYNTTTPVDTRVAEAARPYWDLWFGNPSSDHAYAEGPRQAIALARKQVAALIGAAVGEIVFTGSGSEADQLAIRGAVLAGLWGAPGNTAHVVTQVTEHPAVLACCRALERWHGAQVTWLPVDSSGLVDPEAVADALARPGRGRGPAVVSVMLANNETGTMQPVGPIADAAHEHGALLHVDAAQAAGKTSIDVTALGADLLTVVGHKMYAPKGVAALYVRAGTALEPVIYGGGQERGLRAGTENVALIAALGAAAELARYDPAPSCCPVTRWNGAAIPQASGGIPPSPAGTCASSSSATRDTNPPWPRRPCSSLASSMPPTLTGDSAPGPQPGCR